MNFLNVFKFELYKLLKSRKMYFIYALAILAALFAPIDSYVIKHYSYSALNVYCSSGAGFGTVLLVPFAVIIVSEDFSSGYIKNIYPQVNKKYYVLIKMCFIALFCLACFLLDFLLVVIFNAIFGSGKLINANEVEKTREYLEQIGVKVLCQVLGGTAFGSIIAFFTYVIKNGFIVLAAGYVYGFFASNLLENLLNKIFKTKIACYFLPSYVLNQNQANKYFAASLIVMVVFAAVFTFFGWLVFAKKQVE